MSDQTCGNCKHGSFTLTPKGKSMKGKPGRCRYIVQDPVIPISMSKRLGFVPLSSTAKNAICPDDTDCPVWEEKGET